MSAQVLEGHIRIDEFGCGGSEIYLGDVSVAEWANDVIPRNTAHPYNRKVKAVLMIEDAECLKAQGDLTASEGDGGYSSWTPGNGPSVYVWDDDGKISDIGEILADHPCRNAALSLELVE